MELKTTWKSLCFLVILFTVTCRGVTSQQPDSWLKVNYHPVCFGAKDNQYGSVGVPKSGNIAGVKLVHLSGYVSCATNSITNWSFWGCGLHNSVKKHVNVVITTSNNNVVAPPNQFFNYGHSKWAEIPGYNSLSPEIVLPFFSPFSVSNEQELRVWYGEDLVNTVEGDNGGRVCCDVYVLYVGEVQ